MHNLFKKRLRIPRYYIAASTSLLFIIAFIIWHTVGAPAFPAIHNQYGIAFSDIGTYSPSTLDARLHDVAQLGFKWIRLDFTWSTIEAHNPTNDNWASTDRVIAAAAKYHLQVLGILDYTPSWARSPNCPTSAQCAPADPETFAAFAAKAAARYKDQGITNWEIWNEENILRFWQPTPSPMAYTKLLIASYSTIKKVSPDARVILGGMSSSDNNGTNIDAVTFLKQVYAYGGKNSFDAIAYHPYTNPLPPVDGVPAWDRMSKPLTGLTSVLSNEGDGAKQIWITEYGAPTNGPSATHVNEAAQAGFVSDAVSYLKVFPWAGPFFWYTYQDTSTNTSTDEHFFGLRRTDGSAKPAYDAWRHILMH